MSSSSNGVDLIFLALVGGPALLAWGLASLKEERLVQDTPLSKVRSAAMGLVALQGIAKARREMFEPIDKALCCWWHCKVEEYRSNGKSSRWVTVKEVSAEELLYVQDETGKVLVDPKGAEIYVTGQVFPLNEFTRSKIEPVLVMWGVNDETWFGMKQMRLIELAIFPDYPLYVLGMLDQHREFAQGRQLRLTQRLDAVKSDPQKMKAVLDANGAVDAMAWETLMQKEQAAFAQDEAATEAQIPDSDKVVVRKPDNGNFVLSVQSDKELARSLGHKGFFMVLGGIAAAGAGTALALAHGFSVQATAIFVVIGFIAGMVVARFSHRNGSRRMLWEW